MDSNPRTLYLLDGTSQLFRAHFALPPITTSAGMATGAIYGFTSMLRKLQNDHRPDYLAVAFDPPGKSFRNATYPAYKANRPPAPAELNAQSPYARTICEVLGIRTVERTGFEADDVIATYTAEALARGYEVVVVSSDKDLMQLVQDGVRMFNPTKEIWLDAPAVEREFGVPPGKVLDTQGLMGDSVDNIPGVPGVGEKTAVSMIGTYGDLDAVLERAGRFVAFFDARDTLLEALEALEAAPVIDAALGRSVVEALARTTTMGEVFARAEADPAMRERAGELFREIEAVRAAAEALPEGEPGKNAAKPFRALKKALKALDKGSQRRIWYAAAEYADQARLSRQLATLDNHVPEIIPIDDLAVALPDRPRALALFRTLEFKALIAEFEGAAAPAGVDTVTSATSVETVTDAARLRALAGEIATAGRVAVELVQGEGGPLAAPLVGLALAHSSDRGAYVPLGHAYLGAPAQLTPAQAAQALAPVFGDRSVAKSARDLKAVAHLLGRYGMPLEGWGVDLNLAAFLLESDRSDYALPRLAVQYVGRALQGEDDPFGSGAKRALPSELQVERVAAWAGERAEVVARLAAELRGKLEEEKLDHLYDTIDGPLLPLLRRMEARGVLVDTSRLGAMGTAMEGALDELRVTIHRLAGGEFNVDSPKQLREVLFDKLGLKPGRQTAKSKVASTDAQTLEELADEHEIAARLLEYRELSKLKGTYVDALPRLVDPTTGRVHTRYDPTGAATGRLSSLDPNLQNIPVRSEAGRRIREAFVAEEGWLFLASDYSQVELRVLAHLCGDAGLKAAFRAGEDIHRYTASKVAGILPDLVTSDMRRRAKAVNFGILYGMSETRLAREQGIGRGEARKFIAAYFERFASVRRYIDDVREQVMRDAEVRTMFGRVRRFPQLRQRVHRGIVEQALRAAVNTTIQGTAADLMKMAMLRVEAALLCEGLGARMLLQVHDELLLEVPREEAERTREVVREAMEGVHPLEVPLLVDQKTGGNWREVA